MTQIRASSAYSGRVAKRELLVFDGDDTLWFVEPLYDAARQKAKRLVEGQGFDGGRWEELQREIDVRNVATMGLTAKRFPTSCVQAYEELMLEAGSQPSDHVREEIYQVAATVFSAPAPLAREATQVLSELQSEYAVAILTRGEEWVQKRRIKESGLRGLVDHVSIVEEKTVRTFQSVLDYFGLPPRNAWSIGNSLAHDIEPAVRLGMRAIWIDAHVWEYERRAAVPVSGDYLIARDLLELPSLLRMEESRS